MSGWDYALWGAFGGFAVEAIETLTAINRIRAWPWGKPEQVTIPAGLSSLFIRLSLGAIVAAAAGLGGAVTGILGPFGAGISAPLFVEKIGQAVAASAKDNSIAANASQQGGGGVTDEV